MDLDTDKGLSGVCGLAQGLEKDNFTMSPIRLTMPVEQFIQSLTKFGPVPESVEVLMRRRWFREHVLREVRIVVPRYSHLRQNLMKLSYPSPPVLRRQTARWLDDSSSGESGRSILKELVPLDGSLSPAAKHKTRKRSRKRRSKRKLAPMQDISVDPDTNSVVQGNLISRLQNELASMKFGSGDLIPFVERRLPEYGKVLRRIHKWVTTYVPDATSVVVEEIAKSYLGSYLFVCYELVNNFDASKKAENIKMMLPAVFHLYISSYSLPIRFLAHTVYNRVARLLSQLPGMIRPGQFIQPAARFQNGGGGRRGPINNQPPLVIPPGQGGLAPAGNAPRPQRQSEILAEDIKVNELRADLAEQPDNLRERREKFLRTRLAFDRTNVRQVKLYHRNWDIPRIFQGEHIVILPYTCGPVDRDALSLGYVTYSNVDVCMRQAGILLHEIRASKAPPNLLWQTVEYWLGGFNMDTDPSDINLALYVVQQHAWKVFRFGVDLPGGVDSMPTGNLNDRARLLISGVHSDGMRGSQIIASILSLMGDSEGWTNDPNSSLSASLGMLIRIAGRVQRIWLSAHRRIARSLDLQPHTHFSLMTSMIITSSSAYLGISMTKWALMGYIRRKRLLVTTLTSLTGLGVCAIERAKNTCIDWVLMGRESYWMNRTKRELSDWQQKPSSGFLDSLRLNRITELVSEEIKRWCFSR